MKRCRLTLTRGAAVPPKLQLQLEQLYGVSSHFGAIDAQYPYCINVPRHHNPGELGDGAAAGQRIGLNVTLYMGRGSRHAGPFCAY